MFPTECVDGQMEVDLADGKHEVHSGLECWNSYQRYSSRSSAALNPKTLNPKLVHPMFPRMPGFNSFGSYADEFVTVGVCGYPNPKSR